MDKFKNFKTVELDLDHDELYGDPEQGLTSVGGGFVQGDFDQNAAQTSGKSPEIVVGITPGQREPRQT